MPTLSIQNLLGTGQYNAKIDCYMMPLCGYWLNHDTILFFIAPIETFSFLPCLTKLITITKNILLNDFDDFKSMHLGVLANGESIKPYQIMH